MLRAHAQGAAHTACILRHLLRLGETRRRDAREPPPRGKPRSRTRSSGSSSRPWTATRAPTPSRIRRTRTRRRRRRGPSRTRSGCVESFEYPDVVVSVARKTDSREWPALFKHAGDPALLQANALAAGQLRTAACYLLVVDKLVSADVGAKAADEVLRAALERRKRLGRRARPVFGSARGGGRCGGGGAALGGEKKRRGDDADEDVGIVSGLFRSGSARRRNRRNPNRRRTLRACRRADPSTKNSSKPPGRGARERREGRGDRRAPTRPTPYATRPRRRPRLRRRPRRARRVCPRDGF